MTAAIQTSRLTASYLIVLPLLLLLGIAAALLTVLIAPYTTEAIDIAALLTLGALTASSLLSALFAVWCYSKARSSTDRWALVAIFVLIAAVALGTGIVVTVTVYAIALLGTRQTPRITAKTILVRMGIPTLIVGLLCALSLVGFINLLTGDHYYSEPTVRKGGFYYTELYDTTLTELVEADDSHAVGIYSYTAANEANTKLGFALFATKETNSRTLYCYIDDSGFCYSDAIYSGNNEGYAEKSYDANGFSRFETRPWGEWHRLSDEYAICLIPVSSDRTPDKGVEVVRSAEVTFSETAFRLYVGLGKVA